MKPMRGQIGRELRWLRTSLMPTEYELHSGDDIVARIVTKGWFRRTAEITLAEDRWVIRPPRLITRSLLIERQADGEPVALYEGRLRSGDLTFTSGEVFTISRQGLFPLSIRVDNATGSRILTVNWGWPSIRNVGQVQIEAAGSAEPLLGLLTVIAFHVLVLRRRRAARSG